MWELNELNYVKILDNICKSYCKNYWKIVWKSMLLCEASNWFYTQGIFSSTNRTDNCQSSSKLGSIKDALEKDLALFHRKIQVQNQENYILQSRFTDFINFLKLFAKCCACIAFPRNPRFKKMSHSILKRTRTCVQRTVAGRFRTSYHRPPCVFIVSLITHASCILPTANLETNF